MVLCKKQRQETKRWKWLLYSKYVLPKRCCRCNAAASGDCFEASFFFVGAFKEALTFGSAPQSISFISYVVVVVRPSQECTPSANLDAVLRILSIWLSLALNFGCVTVHEHTITGASLRGRIMELKNEKKKMWMCVILMNTWGKTMLRNQP